MRPQKVIKKHLTYAVLHKKSGKIDLCRYKTQVARLIGVSVRTVQREVLHENEAFKVFLIGNVYTTKLETLQIRQ